jgi:DNA-binding transcriptional regulator YdaS (Cro superfamily)
MGELMKLADWLDGDETADPPRPKIAVAEFARRIGLPQPTVHRYTKGERIPEPEAMAKIVAETAGAVTPNDFYDIETSPSTVPDVTRAPESSAA